MKIYYCTTYLFVDFDLIDDKNFSEGYFDGRLLEDIVIELKRGDRVQYVLDRLEKELPEEVFLAIDMVAGNIGSSLDRIETYEEILRGEAVANIVDGDFVAAMGPTAAKAKNACLLCIEDNLEDDF